ncbi:sensor histidine kinase [Actinomadura rudentiformis]|uniref:histidine kinase n=1 Tax=Actinomadura rudentiformis TaxID=359158 RepID=A0A6H9Z9C8_9ACTN|nr:nitrate- and nitrite sensing domain-containing protein [Actinomadura rudentiformis]KAB2350714.1 HAMP domain-containing protein [Actinomadura rudentiformis]
MRFRNSRLRTKIVALLLSLIALWAFAAWVTLREGVNLLGVTAVDGVVAPTDPMLADLQRERRLSITHLAGSHRQRSAILAAQRARTDKSKQLVIRKARGGAFRRAAGPELERRTSNMLRLLDALDENRRAIDNGLLDRARANKIYSDMIESVFRMYDAAGSLDDKDFANDTRIEIAVNRSWELLAQEDAVVAGVLTTGRLTPADQLEISKLVGARHLVTDRALADLPDADTKAHRELLSNRRLAEVRSLENVLLQKPLPGQRPRITAEQWRATTEPAIAQMRQTIQSAGDRLVERAMPIAIWVVVRLLLAGGLGLIAVIASIIVSITTARALVRQLEKLRQAAWELAEQRLPDVVERLGHGAKVDVAKEAPPLEFGSDEIGQVGRAFNAVQETAIRTAVEQAELRRGIRDVLLSLARRTQTLVHRQLSMLDQMERKRDIDPKDLQELFRLDHLATRMRRNAENLIVLSGAIPARGWRRSVPMVDVIRGAVGEVEDYTRVEVMPIGNVELTGRAVGDVTHLLAELIENAVTFSPPDTVVQIGGHAVASGFAIDIEDRGLGMDDQKLTEINQRIADPPEFNLQSSVQLGLFVVGKLAERYGLQVSLKRSAYGGTTAVVVIPRELVTEGDNGSTGPRRLPAGAKTTENGLAVRQPVLTTAPAGTATDTARVTAISPAAEAPPVPEPPPLAEVPPVKAPLDEDPGPDDAKDTAPEEERPMPEVSSTPGGLPVRVPQASLAPALKTDEPVVAEEPDEEDPGRSPEEIQRIMGSYQRGSVRGRNEAAARTDTAEGEDEQ